MEKLKISKRTLFEWQKKGILTANIYKGRNYYHIRDLLALLKKNYK
jgi:DNA-binding transcriptional MerR regulator